MDIHRGYMGRLGITREELNATPAALDNLSYTSYMLRVAYEGGEAEILTAILSCAYSYEVIAKNIVANNPASAGHPLYGEWVRGRGSFSGFRKYLPSAPGMNWRFGSWRGLRRVEADRPSPADR